MRIIKFRLFRITIQSILTLIFGSTCIQAETYVWLSKFMHLQTYKQFTFIRSQA